MGPGPSTAFTGTAFFATVRRSAVAAAQVVGFGVAWLLVAIPLMAAAKTLVGDWGSGGADISEIFFEGLITVISVGMISGVLVWGLQSQHAGVEWARRRDSLRGFGVGTLAGCATASGMVALTAVLGGGSFEVDISQAPAYVSRLPLLVGVLSVSAMGEEWLVRGYPLTRLSAATGKGWAVLITAVLFSAAHHNSEGYTVFVAVNILIGGLLLGGMRFTSGGLAAAWGAHVAWNATQIACGATLTGLDLGVPMIRFISAGPVWASGGQLGPEGGVGATFATLIALVILTRYAHRKGWR